MTKKSIVKYYDVEDKTGSYEKFSSFSERIRNPDDCPITMAKRTPLKNLALDNGPLIMHFSESCELLICKNISGEIVIPNNKITFDHSDVVFFIPPNMTHATMFTSGTDGDEDFFVYVLQVNFEKLEKYANLKEIFDWDDYTFKEKHLMPDCFDKVVALADKIYDEKSSVHETITNLIEIFSEVNKSLITKADPELIIDAGKADLLKELLFWTSQHFCEKISTDDAARILHFNKSYFCRFFKKATGMSYMNYVNQLRISYSIELLLKGQSATDCCYKCGFENFSYFIQLFKKATGCTPKEFSKNTKLPKNKQ